jgi:uncharacterized protein (DUF4213/DUF364 family)
MTNNEIYLKLKKDLQGKIEGHNLSGTNIDITCRALSSKEAIGTPDHNDYPIVKGREIMIEANFKGAAGQAFTDEFANNSFSVEKLLEIDHESTRNRASFVAGLNAVYRYLQLCDKTIHCRDKEPVECAEHLSKLPDFKGKKILLVGYQPRFLEYLTRDNQVRVLDLDPENIGHERFGVVVESTPQFAEALNWCEMIFATGSTLVNGTISEVLDQGKPVVFYGVTISAAATILNLDTFCNCGH